MSAPPLRRRDLTAAEVEAVRALERRARATDGPAPLSEQSLLWLAERGAPAEHLLTYAGADLAAYAQVSGAELGSDASAELVVHPDHRRHGLGRDLTEAILDLAPAARVWAHGNLAPAQALAASGGWVAERELHKLSRPLTAQDADLHIELPSGFTARPFRLGQDEDAWLETNAAAFAHHPEQGRLALGDLRERQSQPWFDPAGLILVEHQDEPGRVAAFHWTKVDPEQRSNLDPSKPAGEVYVVGVHPAYQGRGLGGPVTALGLAHLARLGLPEVVLYVDADNTAAIKTYTRLGFRSIMVDVMYSHPVHPPLSG